MQTKRPWRSCKLFARLSAPTRAALRAIHDAAARAAPVVRVECGAFIARMRIGIIRAKKQPETAGAAGRAGRGGK